MTETVGNMASGVFAAGVVCVLTLTWLRFFFLICCRLAGKTKKGLVLQVTALI